METIKTIAQVLGFVTAGFSIIFCFLWVCDYISEKIRTISSLEHFKEKAVVRIDSHDRKLSEVCNILADLSTSVIGLDNRTQETHSIDHRVKSKKKK